MDQPVRTAFCPVFFASNGGTFTESGLPILKDEEQVRGLCDVPFDCESCMLLDEWVVRWGVDYAISWECGACIKATPKESRVLPGFYTAGRIPRLNPHPDLEDFDNEDPDGPSLDGCTVCGWQTSFLQLVLRPKSYAPEPVLSRDG